MKKYNRKKYLNFLKKLEILLEEKSLSDKEKIHKMKMLILIEESLEILGGNE